MFGDAVCILLLNNCTAHKINKKFIPSNVHVLFLPVNMTSKHQPADMGMIAALKVGHRV